MSNRFSVQTSNPEETQEIGRIIGRQARPGDVYLLVGPLGAGKTCLTQGIAEGLGVTGYVRSPTFVLMTRYQGNLTLHHVDLYRVEDPWEAWDLGLEEQIMGDGVCVIEWADRAEEIFPEKCLWLELDYGDEPDNRSITIETDLEHFQPLLTQLKENYSHLEAKL